MYGFVIRRHSLTGAAGRSATSVARRVGSTPTAPRSDSRLQPASVNTRPAARKRTSFVVMWIPPEPGDLDRADAPDPIANHDFEVWRIQV